jgi:hypothetical protein
MAVGIDPVKQEDLRGLKRAAIEECRRVAMRAITRGRA